MIGTVALAVVVGALERLWLLVHIPFNSDEAVVGLMARQIAHGHLSTFYWGQPFGGVEPYLVAAVNRIVPGPLGVDATPVLLSALAAVLVGLIVTELCGRWRAGLVAGTLAWVWPYATVYNSTRELGFHFVSLVLGLLMLFMAIRIAHGRTGTWNLLVLGLSAGLGFWASPEIVYFVLPSAIVLLGSLRRWIGLRAVCVAVSGFIAGALPWISTNIGSGFASLSLSGPQPGISTNYWSRLHIAFNEFVPIALGLKALNGGSVGGRKGDALEIAVIVVLVTLLALALATAWHFIRTKKDLGLVACGAGVIAFPFLLAANDKTWFWLDGRYSVDLSFLVAIFAVASVSVIRQGRRSTLVHGGHARVPQGGRWPTRVVPVFACSVVLVATLLTVAQSGAQTPGGDFLSARVGVNAMFAGWNDPNAQLQASLRSMDAQHIRVAYADYWTAYVTDYLDPSLVVTPSQLDVVRSQSLLDTVEHSPRPAWLFSSPSHLAEAGQVFGAQEGPGGYSETSFLTMLANRGIHARVVHLGLLDAVIPDHKVVIR
jgi:hypothetical protein